MITCSRCGKENQNSYKFCLGCGAKLAAAAAAPPAEPPVAVPLAMAATAVPPAPLTASTMAATAVPPAPLGDDTTRSPPVPDLTRGAPVAASPAPPARRPETSSGPAMVSGVIGNAGTARGATPVAARPAPAPVAAAPAAAGGAVVPLARIAPTHVPASMARDAVACPSCGKPVGGGFAFCGSCGHRMKPAAAPAVAAAPAAAAPIGRTMYMGAPAPAAKPAPRGHLTLIRPDGTEGGIHPLQEGENLIGRGQGSLFDADPYLSPRHAEFVLTDEGLIVRDLRSLNGVFMKISQEEKLESGDIFRIGQELLRFDVIGQPMPLEDGTEIVGTPNPGYWGRVSVIVGRDVDGPAFPLFDESIVLGRERGDILFPEDGYVSGTHAQITLRDGQVFVSDLGSSNGSFFRIRGSRLVPQGSLILMGQQLFRVAYR